jgi:ABC-2 type transport system permease protein
MTVPPEPPPLIGARGGAAETGVIHDIGYRHYNGPRLGRAYVTRSLFMESWKGAYGLGRAGRTKIVPMLMFGLACGVALIMALSVTMGGGGELPVPYTGFADAIELIIALFLAGQAPASVSRDLRYRVISLYFSRPLTRLDYVHAKIAALTAAIFALIAVPMLVMYAGALLAKLPFLDQTRGLLEGLAGAFVLSLLLAVIGLVIAAVTPRRGLGVAAIIAVLLTLGAVHGALSALASSEGQRSLSQYSALLAPFRLIDGLQAWVFRLDPAAVRPPGTVGGLVFLAVTVAVIAGGYGLLRLRYRKVSVS